MRPVVAIFAKFPARGRVKTRLAAGIGDAAALRFHRAMLERTCRIAARGPWRIELWVTPDASARRRRAWPRAGRAGLRSQGTGDIGARMARALAHRHGPVLLVGCDIPGLETVHLRAALALLGTNEFVFGPATDGGFWLVGLRPGGRLDRAFDRVRWSGPDALSDTLANLRGRRVGLAAALADIDEPADLAAWYRGRARA